ncbi:hypothetical protein [Sphingobium phenoxybenzoativorans]|uniref:hypothetical protein n=1 Tax=Sphingobium phenoxybenzoativorans TaxID=1592790 RepID=UPI0009F62F88|nr:hypothetical protein [Sphingobium phenoxybenzoativorans]
MATMQLSFLALLLLSCGYAFLRGGRDGRWAAFLLMSAAMLTIPASWIDVHWASTNMAVFAVDLALLAGLLILALRSHSYWPIWMAAFHALSVCTHIATAINPVFVPKVYQALESFWSIPVQLVMPFGIMLDDYARGRRQRSGNGHELHNRQDGA